MSKLLESFEDLIADFEAFKSEHKEITDPKTFHLYVIRQEHVAGEWLRELDAELKRMGLAYCQKFHRWYWHNHLERQRDFDLRDARLLEALLYPAVNKVVDLG